MTIQLGLETRAAKDSPLLKAVLEAVEDPMLVLNAHRQVLLTNVRANEILEPEDAVDTANAVGRRPGELFRCIHADKSPAGCGGSKACLDCGALQAVQCARRNKRSETREFLLSRRCSTGIEAAEYRVRATPFQVGGHVFTTVLLHDISDHKRREALERIFFHDLMNTIGGLRGWSETLAMKKGPSAEIAAQQIVELSDVLVREILDQRMLLEAERGDLATAFQSCLVRDAYELIQKVFSRNPVAKEKTLDIRSGGAAQRISTDPGLLARVLVNLVKNAFEATPVGGTVKLWHFRDDGRVTFHVWNAGAISVDVAGRVFQRSFSTKASKGRGLGTYSARLLTERYLGGQVTFRSTPEDGTTFLVELPD